ncbi:Signal peptidase complex subunit [Thecaphora frezii]
MHSSISRINTVFALATSVLLCMLAVIDTTSYPRHKPTGKVAIKSLETLSALNVCLNDRISGRAVWHMDRRIQDFVVTSFDIDADFADLFQWNTKQVFVSLVAEYKNKKGHHNQVVIWDRILRSAADAHVSLVGEENKYGLREVSKSFGGVKNTTFVLKYNVMPKVGQLHYGDEFASTAFTIPNKVVGTDENGNKVKQKIQQLYY